MIESVARQVLTLMGAKVEEVATSDKEESDWLATFDDFTVLIEEKTKFENPARTAARGEALKGNEVHGTTTPLGPDRGISRIVHKAARQLRSTGADRAHDVRVIWFTSTGFDRETKDFQAFNTLYGATKVFDLDQSASLRDCYFFHNSDFFRHRDIDGAVLAVFDGHDVSLRLCLNPYSDRWINLRDSSFGAKSPGAIDPVAREAEGLVMIADTDLDRRKPEEVMNYLRNKYKVPMLQQMDMQMATAVIAVPKL